MNTFTHHAGDGISSLLAALDRYAEPVIDPAFDDDTDELDRQFAAVRLARAGEQERRP
jgi:hypothetical protein